MLPATENTISTLELLRAGWPIVVAIVAVIAYVLRTKWQCDSTEKRLEDFVRISYPADQSNANNNIEKAKLSVENAENKLELRLEQFASKTDLQLQKLYDQVNDSNKILAEMKGRLANLNFRENIPNAK